MRMQEGPYVLWQSSYFQLRMMVSHIILILFCDWYPGQTVPAVDKTRWLCMGLSFTCNFACMKFHIEIVDCT